MKKFKFFVAITFLAITFLGCSSDSPSSSTSQWAMTAKVNGVQWEVNNAFNSNYATPSIYSYYPDADYIQLQGRYGGTFGINEIDLWIKRTDLQLGTYPVGPETDAVTTHIDLIDNSNSESENTLEGSITITEINTTTKVVKGTFNFTTSDDTFATPPVVNETITEGTFNYRYDTGEGKSSN